MNRVQAAIAEAGAARDSPAGLRDAGVEVIVGKGQFVDGSTIQADGHRLRFASAIVATGSELPPRQSAAKDEHQGEWWLGARGTESRRGGSNAP